MADLVVIEYDDEFKAHDVRLTLLKLQQQYLIDLEDAVVAVKDAKGKVKLHQETTGGQSISAEHLGIRRTNP